MSHLREEFQGLNRFLVDSGLKPHLEPEDLPEEQVFSCQMWGYSGLHHLRRVAAHLALGRTLPEPITEDVSNDPIVERYYAPLKHLIVVAPPGIVFAAAGSPEFSATGEEMAEMFDVDVASVARPQARVDLHLNVIAVLFTLGLGTPWAVIRTFRYRMKHLIVAAPTTAVFAAAPASEVSATGEEMAEMFDVHVDFGL